MSPQNRGANDAYQDMCEGCLFSSVGSEYDMKAPYYIKPVDHADYLAGYEAEVLHIYGPLPSVEEQLRDRLRR